MVPVTRQRPLPSTVSGERSAATAAEAPPAGGSAPGWRAAPAIIVAWAAAPGWGRTPVTRALLAIGQLDPHTATAQIPAVQLSDSVCSIARVLKLYESKARGVPGHPHAAQGAVVAERPLQLGFITIIPQVPHVHLAVQRAVSMHGRISHFNRPQESKQKLLLRKHESQTCFSLLLRRG